MTTRRKILISVGLLLGICVTFGVGYDYGRFKEHVTAGEDFKIATTQVAVASLFQALTNYFATYGRWPCATNRAVDTTFGPGTQAEVINALVGLDKNLNPSGKMFLAMFPHLYRAGEFVDPWTNAIYISFDLDKDGKCYSPRWDPCTQMAH